MEEDKIYLVGFMGCGKSTLGRKLAKFMKWKFVDLDEYIEKRENNTISKIFSEKGEAYFRALESNVLKESADWYNTVVSCGGGTPCFNKNMELLNNLGLSIFINLSPDILAERLKGEREKRPLIAKFSDAEMLDFINAKLSERLKYYQSSKLIFNYTKEKEAEFLNRFSNL